MTHEKFLRLVRWMRQAQKAFFRTSGRKELRAAQDAEERVDAALAELREGPGLFDEPPPAAPGSSG